MSQGQKSSAGESWSWSLTKSSAVEAMLYSWHSPITLSHTLVCCKILFYRYSLVGVSQGKAEASGHEPFGTLQANNIPLLNGGDW
jgi:hypothetical protein